MNINHVVVAGRLGRDPELKQTPQGTQVASFSIATNRNWKDKNTGEKREETEWVNCVAWGRTAEVIAQYFTKGKEIYIEGRMQTRSWEKDGQKRYSTEVVVGSFQFVGSANAQTTGGVAPSEDQPAPAADVPTVEYPDEDINPDDIPF